MVKITKLEAENIKRVRAVTMKPAQNGLTVIGGRNGQGKTSVLDAIIWGWAEINTVPAMRRGRDPCCRRISALS